MDAAQFVSAVKQAALEGAVESSEANLARPPGRSPPAELVELSRWYNGLSADERQRVRQALRLAAGHAVSTFLSILDGAKAIEAGPDKGRLELRYVKQGSGALLNDINGVPLNDLLGP